MSDFEKLVEPHRPRLRLHCYRMLGSSCDAEDMVQEAFARAFRSLSTLEDPALVRPWLYRIATNVCLDELARRPRRARGTEGAPHDPSVAPSAATPDSEWIEPSPSAWTTAPDPGTQYSARESVALAFVAALQVLTPAQRAVLLLRDVVGLTAEETATALDGTVSAVNSSLHRARVALEAKVGPRQTWSPEAAEPVDRDLLERYLNAWQSGDLQAIVALLHAEATFSMPPVPVWFSGRLAIARFFENRFCSALRTPQFGVRLIEASARPAIAFYRPQQDGRAHLFAIHVIGVRDERIAEVDHLMAKSALVAFRAEGLAETLPLEDGK
jgi:RNA polymerase sigma-70 factor (ECF subfamily)